MDCCSNSKTNAYPTSYLKGINRCEWIQEKKQTASSTEMVRCVLMASLTNLYYLTRTSPEAVHEVGESQFLVCSKIVIN